MTERDWLACTEPAPMLDYLRGKASGRKLRLFAVACCHRMHRYTSADHRGRAFLPVAEQLADGHATAADVPASTGGIGAQYLGHEATLADAWGAARAACAACCMMCITMSSFSPGDTAGRVLRRFWSGPTSDEAEAPAVGVEQRSQAGLLRDIFGPVPLRPVPFDPDWRTSTAIALAQGMYDARDFGALPILADALQDAGCEDSAVLDHCRGDGPHVRGCWVVDLVLGKA